MRPKFNVCASAALAMSLIAALAGQAEAKTSIYLNRDGGSYTPGADDPTQNIGSIFTQNAAAAPWAIDDSTWAQTIECVEGLFADFDVDIVASEPVQLPYVEVVVTGSEPGGLGYSSNFAGLGPHKGDCSVVENPITVVFAPPLADEMLKVCHTIGFTVGVSLGLDIAIGEGEVMSYLLGDSKVFTDAELSCGEFEPRSCQCGGTTQNSHALLMEKLGARGTGDVPDPEDDPEDDVTDDASGSEVVMGGCSAVGSTPGAWSLALLVVFVRLGRRRRAH